MSDQNLVTFIIIFIIGLIFGVILTLLTNKMRSGSASPASVKREMEDYQDKVEAHLDESSKKFKQMADQYSDLYKHLSIGATTLCRPENISPGLMADQNPLIEKLDTENKATIETTSETEPSEPIDNVNDEAAETDAKIKAELEKLKTDQTKNKPVENAKK